MIYFISACFFFIRLINLNKLPIFNDEAIYLDWGQRAFLLPDNFYFSLSDGKPPLLIWLFGLVALVFPDPLWAGRAISVLTGFLSLLAIYFIAKTLFNRSVAIISSLQYIFSPLLNFFDRQALMESAITAVGLWSIFFYLKLDKTNRPGWAVCLGLVLGLGLFVKTSAAIFLLAILLALLMTKKFNFLLIVLAASQFILIPLYSQPNFWSGLTSNNRYSLTIKEIVTLPLAIWGHNILSFLEIAFWHLTPLVFLTAIGGIILTTKTRQRNIGLVYLFLIPLVFFSLVARDVNPRYLTPFLPLLFLFSSTFVFWIFSTKLQRSTAAIIVLIPGIFILFLQVVSPLSYFSLLDCFTKQSQKFQYVNSWTSGYGVFEAIQYISDKHQKALAGVRLDAGNPENAVFAYLQSSKNIAPMYFDQKLFGNRLEGVDCLETKIPFYFISRDRQLAGLDKYLIEEKLFYKPEKESYVGVFRLKKDCQNNTLILNFQD